MKDFIKAMTEELRQTALGKLTPEQRALLPKCKLKMMRPRYIAEGKLCIEGRIDGHKVRIMQGIRAVGGAISFSGTIDGGAIQSATAKEKWDKYYPIAYFQDCDFKAKAKWLVLAKEAERVAKTL